MQTLGNAAMIPVSVLISTRLEPGDQWPTILFQPLQRLHPPDKLLKQLFFRPGPKYPAEAGC